MLDNDPLTNDYVILDVNTITNLLTAYYTVSPDADLGKSKTSQKKKSTQVIVSIELVTVL